MKSFARVLAASLLVAGLTVAAPRDEKEAKAKAEEVKKLQGNWKVVREEMMGREVPEKDRSIDRVVFAGDKMTFGKGGEELLTVAFEVYPDHKPKGLLMKKETKEGTGMHPVVYEIDGKTLRLCYPLLTREPPKEAPKPPEGFDTKDKPLGLLVAERQKD